MSDGNVKIGVEIDEADVKASLNRIEGKLEDLEKQTDKTTQSGVDGTTALTAGLSTVSVALVKVGADAITAATEFEAAFSKTRTIMDSTQISIAEMSASIRELSTDSTMSAANVSEAVYQAISGSVGTADAVGFVNDANKLAVAGFTSLTNATDVLTTILNAYGMEASQVAGISNVLIQTQNLGKTSVDELSTSMGRAIATGSAYNVNLQNVSAAYVELTRGGIATAEATTYLSSMLNELGKADSDVAKVLLAETGKSFGELMASGASLADVLETLNRSVNGNAEAFMGLFGSQEAAKAANAILNMGFEDFNATLSQMNEELSGATGTTEQAYRIMTSTSEFIDKRLNNSLNNLGIAFGSQLSPAVNAIKTALADALDWMTKMIEKYPDLAHVAAGVTAGIAAISLALAAYVIKTKLATWETLKLTGALNSNGFTAILSAIGLAVAALVTYALHVASAKSEVSALTLASDSLSDSLSTAMDSIQNSVQQAEATAHVADLYISKLEELESAGVKTDAQQKEWHNTLQMLVSTVPELADIIDLETDNINGGTAALRQNTDAWLENAKAQAYKEYMTDVYKDYSAALVEQEQNQIKLQEAEKRRTEAVAEQSRIRAQLRELEAEAQRKADAYAKESGIIYDKSDFLGDDYQALVGKLNAASAAEGEASEEAKTYSDALDKNRESVEQAEEELGYYEEAVEHLMDTESESAEGREEATAGIDSMIDSINELQTAYDDAQAKAFESIQSQFDLWETAPQIVSTSVDAINKAMQSQIDYWTDYESNLQNLYGRNIDGLNEMMNYIDDGSVEAAATLKAMANATDEEVAAMVAKYDELRQKQRSTSDTVAKVQVDFDRSLDAIQQKMTDFIDDMDVSSQAAEAARSTISAYVDEVRSGAADAADAAAGVREAVINELNGTTFTITARTPSGNRSSGSWVLEPYASGTIAAETGWHLVGEQGPEIVWMSGGEKVMTAEQSREALRTVYPTAPQMRTVGATAPSIGSGGQRTMQIRLDAPLYIDGREFARATAEYIGEEMEFGEL